MRLHELFFAVDKDSVQHLMGETDDIEKYTVLDVFRCLLLQ